jgi:hypothetical protein
LWHALQNAFTMNEIQWIKCTIAHLIFAQKETFTNLNRSLILSSRKYKTERKDQDNFIHFNLRLLLTTLTELNAIAAPAIIGFNKKPVKEYNIPAAIGMPITL